MAAGLPNGRLVVRRWVLKLVLAVAIGLLPAVAATTQAAGAGDPAAAFIAKINALRASKGLAPMEANGPLTTFAAGWTSHMAQTGQLAHNPALSSAPGNWTVVGENVGVGANVDELFQAFVNSPHHYSNLVDPRFNTIGVAVVVDGSGRMWTTHDFEALPTARTSTAPAPAPAPKPTAPVTTAPTPKVSAPAVTKPAAAAPAPAPVAATTPPAADAPPPPAAPAEAPARIRISLELLRGATPSL